MTGNTVTAAVSDGERELSFSVAVIAPVIDVVLVTEESRVIEFVDNCTEVEDASIVESAVVEKVP